MDLDLQLRAVFQVLVCSKCKQERPDDYSLLTKTECREDYLLTDRKSHFSIRLFVRMITYNISLSNS